MVDENSTVTIGSWVQVKDGLDEDEWRIVPCEIADPINGLISEESPMAQALLGHRVGDRVKVLGPEDRRSVVILRISLRPADRSPLPGGIPCRAG